MYTSGSTGTPKGVMITHQGVVNTILDINRRFHVGPADRVLFLSSPCFDLSVYDVFGLLAAGGAVVLPEPDRLRDPAHWLSLIDAYRISLWNSVPTSLEMLVAHCAGRTDQPLDRLRCALLSGDWISVGLPHRFRELAPNCAVISLGGATEASIWSICYPVGEVDPRWRSIPYGRPLAGQTVEVLDEAFRPCPIGVPGELYIGGAGVAVGYLNRPELTRERFLTLSGPGGQRRLYRTGDRGQLLADGNIEFLGASTTRSKSAGIASSWAKSKPRLGGSRMWTRLRSWPAAARPAASSWSPLSCRKTVLPGPGANCRPAWHTRCRGSCCPAATSG